ncbi:MAG: hypothetical protein RL090_703 [Bacteroidota bacterium]|jgi:predicted membrane protein
MQKTLKIVFAILLFLCLAPMPYGYYQFVRLSGALLFAYFALTTNQKGSEGLKILYIALAILFQPFFKISFEREVWNLIDVVVGIFLLYSAYRNPSK